MRCEVSVVINALGNAERLLDLVASVLPQLGVADEVIIVVAPPSPGRPGDMTREVAEEIARQSPSVRVVVREGAATPLAPPASATPPASPVPPAFANREQDPFSSANYEQGAVVFAGCEQGIRATRGAYVFFAEPGDLWAPDKISCVREAFAASGAALVLHDAELLDTSRRVLSPSLFAVRESQQGFRESLLHNSYVGSCLAFRKPLQEYFLPFPPEALRYEQWIGCVAERFGGVALITKALIGKMIVGRSGPVLPTLSTRERRQEQKGMRKALQQREKELSRGNAGHSV
jgi:hypothetical protein